MISFKSNERRYKLNDKEKLLGFCTEIKGQCAIAAENTMQCLCKALKRVEVRLLKLSKINTSNKIGIALRGLIFHFIKTSSIIWI